MMRDQVEKLGSLFLAVFSTGLAARLALDGMATVQWLGASLAVTGSLDLVAGRTYDLAVEFASSRSPFSGLRVGCAPPVPTDLMERAVALWPSDESPQASSTVRSRL